MKGIGPGPAAPAGNAARPTGPAASAISEGGEAIGTQMPAYKLALDDDDRWRLVAFIAADFATGR
ncbi:MAG TPA: hypothetical protein PLG99_00150 [Kaistiaceae bacterium]|nr:hypothetical protein [Kaistiaceae bacterium]